MKSDPGKQLSMCRAELRHFMSSGDSWTLERMEEGSGPACAVCNRQMDCCALLAKKEKKKMTFLSHPMSVQNQKLFLKNAKKFMGC